ncbi:fasciclin-like arabinogalactan protein 8 [Triticum dicoccoides]|uniref:fasciclin-like arabinogalactan protein 8 n=1 Tax=Triticum dicoccoides TaxID=85692 RepID=UPI000E7B4ABC|nr:fasciclin-like arabinogalactan protein 8 [Triticum dicoccoides]
MAGAQLRRVVAVLLLACCCSMAPAATARGMSAGIAHNITSFLSGHPEYKQYNRYLTETRVCDEINARAGVTVLVLGDGAMSTLVSDAGADLGAIKNALRLHALLDYWDVKKLKALPAGADTLTDTFYQAAGGAATSATGSVKMAKLDGGGFGFASAASPGDAYDATFAKALKQTQYDFAVLEVTAPIEFDGLFDGPSVANLTKLLEKAGCKRFAALIASTGVLKDYQAAMADEAGLTLFAPKDDAFLGKGAPDVDAMPRADLVALLRYHALPGYNPRPSLKLVKASARPFRTLASTAGGGKYNVSVVARGDDVSLDTGLRKSRVAETVLDDTPVCVLTVDRLLMPLELFAGAPAEAPSPTPAPAPSPADATPSSPPAPPPADAPSEAAADHVHKDVKASSASALSVGALAAAACSAVLASLL